MAIGPCRLCGVQGEIRDSHLLPRFFYKTTHGPGEHPVFMHGGRAVETSRQITAPVLADCCEKRFSQRGESWAALNLWRADGTFLLRDALNPGNAAPPEDYQLCDAAAAGIDVAPLVYLTASIFWRASVHHWFLGPRTLIELGPYEASLRRYLLDEHEFPPEIAVLVAVNTGSRANGALSLPVEGKRSAEGLRVFHFDAPGVSLGLFVGKHRPAVFDEFCVVRSGRIAISATIDTLRIEAAQRVRGRSRPSRKLARNPSF